MEKEHKLIQSYVVDKYFVSTMYRRASTPEELWYYEIAVWEWNPETKKRGKMLRLDNAGCYPSMAIDTHNEECKKLMKENIELIK